MNSWPSSGDVSAARASTSSPIVLICWPFQMCGGNSVSAVIVCSCRVSFRWCSAVAIQLSSNDRVHQRLHRVAPNLGRPSTFGRREEDSHAELAAEAAVGVARPIGAVGAYFLYRGSFGVPALGGQPRQNSCE